MTVYNLEKAFNSKEFQARKNNLAIPIGIDDEGKVFIDDLNHMWSLFLGGKTGSGKSMFIHTFIASLIKQNKPDDVKFILVDTRKKEFNKYKKSKYLLTEIISDAKKTLYALKWCSLEMNRRFEILASTHKLRIMEYNESLVAMYIRQ